MDHKLTGRVVVYDLEYTAWDGSVARNWSGPGEHREIVQIGAVILDADDGLRETGEFETLVKPRRNPVISDYLVKLTGISAQAVLDRGIDFADALLRFRDFVGDSVTPLLSYGLDDLVLRENCGLTDIDYPFEANSTFNVNPLISRLTGIEGQLVNSGQLPEAMGFAAPGPRHQALYDARCVAEALRILRRRNLV